MCKARDGRCASGTPPATSPDGGGLVLVRKLFDRFALAGLDRPQSREGEGVLPAVSGDRGVDRAAALRRPGDGRPAAVGAPGRAADLRLDPRAGPHDVRGLAEAGGRAHAAASRSWRSSGIRATGGAAGGGAAPTPPKGRKSGSGNWWSGSRVRAWETSRCGWTRAFFSRDMVRTLERLGVYFLLKVPRHGWLSSHRGPWRFSAKGDAVFPGEDLWPATGRGAVVRAADRGTGPAVGQQDGGRRQRRQRPAVEPRNRGLPDAAHGSRTLPLRLLADSAAAAAPQLAVPAKLTPLCARTTFSSCAANRSAAAL